MQIPTTPDQIRGLLFGLAAGDQIGGPIRTLVPELDNIADQCIKCWK